MDVDPDVAAVVAARLNAEGVDVAPAFVADVLGKHVELRGPDELPTDADQRRRIAGRVASALREDRAVVLRVLEAADRGGQLGGVRAWAAAHAPPPPARPVYVDAPMIGPDQVPGFLRWVRHALHAEALGAAVLAAGGAIAAARGWHRVDPSLVVLAAWVAVPGVVLARLVWAQQAAVRTTILVFQPAAALLMALMVVSIGSPPEAALGVMVPPLGMAAALLLPSARAAFDEPARPRA